MGNSQSAVPQTSWAAACANLTQNLTEGLVNQYGKPMNAFLINETWGISITKCYEICGPDRMYQAFNFRSFSTSATNWFLPWLALTAQLPYEASGTGSNIMSGLLAIGSPALITYSLSLTILNHSWVQRRFARLKKESHGQAVKDYAPELGDKISAAGSLLQDAQQAPIRVSQKGGWLSSLIVLPENQQFWNAVEKDLGNTRRGFTASLFAQIFMASIAFVFTIINAFNNVGDDEVALQIASGTVWIWMIPVILGWIIVGTQWRSGAIRRAVNDNNREAFRAPTDGAHPVGDGQPVEGGQPVGDRQLMKGIQQGIIIQPHRSHNRPHVTVLPWLGCSVAGDEEKEGPIYNYARIFTWFECAIQLEKGFSGMLAKLRAKVALNGYTSAQIAEYCNLPSEDDDPIKIYRPWSEVQPKVWHHVLIAALVATFVQWGTTGSAILISYLTPTKGLGCRSGSYLLYGSTATFVWILLTCSSFLSHAIMLRPTKPSRSSGTSILCALAVCTRYTGKTLAAVNAGWLVVTNLLEYIGIFEGCWCNADVLSMGSKGWAAIFPASKSRIVADATGYWAGGVAFSLLVCAASMGFFWLTSRNTGED